MYVRALLTDDSSIFLVWTDLFFRKSKRRCRLDLLPLWYTHQLLGFCNLQKLELIMWLSYFCDQFFRKAKLCQSKRKEPVEGRQIEDRDNIEFEEKEMHRLSGIWACNMWFNMRHFPILGSSSSSYHQEFYSAKELMRVNQAATKLSGQRSFCSL